MPFFTGSNETERYARNRPYFHPLVITRAKKAMGIRTAVPLALDVACGTGQSTTALLAIAERVIGMDISFNMLANARRDPRVRTIQALAESIPMPDRSLPLLSTALAFHWFDRDQFLGEAWRVLSDEGLLLIYTNGFTGLMRDNPAFQPWSHEVYPRRFPVPPRDSRPFTEEEAARAGFSFIAEERFENDVRFTPEELVAYLCTQTNVAAAIRLGRESIESAIQSLLEQVRPFFSGAAATFVFVTRAWYLRKGSER
jgi:SAM-dependent methyltransferase